MNLHDLDNLELNKNYKYKELCTLFNENIFNGNSKKAQFKEWERYIKIEKGEKATFIITEIYEIPLQKEDNRGKSDGSRANNVVYGEYIDRILIDYLQNTYKNGICIKYITNNVLAEVLGIINCNFRVANNKKVKFKQFISTKEIKITNTAMYSVFNKANEIKRKPIIASLDRLQKQELIDWDFNYMIFFEYSVRNATEDESKIIFECEEQALEQMNITDRRKLMKNDKLKNKFYDIVNFLAKQSLEECDGIFQGFKITIQESILDIRQLVDIQKLRTGLNQLIIRKVKDKMITNKINIENEYHKGIGIINPFLPKWIQEILDGNYLTYTDIVIHYILDIKSKRITNEIEKQVINTYKKDWDDFTKSQQYKMLDEATDEGMEDIYKEIDSLF